MTRPAVSPNAAVVALQLARGSLDARAARCDWQSVLDAARTERLVALAWLRSGAAIRSTAPECVSQLWRADVVALGERARLHWSASVALVDLLMSSGIPVLVLKGVPLSLRLYGDLVARGSGDIDLLVPHEARAVARSLLQKNGWEHWHGRAPWDENYRTMVDGRRVYLEVHTLTAGNALAHCGLLPLQKAVVAYESTIIPAASGPAMVAYLAANLAKHSPIPLRSFLDLATLWSSMPQCERTTAWMIARRARLHRYVRWAIDRAMSLTALTESDERALASLGFSGAERRAAHAYFRLVSLAAHPLDAARVVTDWAWPRALRRDAAATRAFWQRRLREPLHGRFVYRRVYA